MFIIYFTLSTIIQMTRIQMYTISYNPFIQDKIMNTTFSIVLVFLEKKITDLRKEISSPNI